MGNKNFISRLLSDDLVRHTLILFSGMMVVHVCNLVYQMMVSRALPKEEYTLLAAFLGALIIIQRPLTTLTTGISHYSSILKQEQRVGDVKRLLQKWTLLAGIPSIVLGALVVLFSGQLAIFFNLDRTAPVLIAGFALPALFCLPVLQGAGQGLQLFGWASAASVFGALFRLGLGAGFVWFVYPACGWAMLGHGLGIYVSAVVMVVVLFFVLRKKTKSTETLPSMRFYLLQSFFIQAAFAVLMTADVVLVKHHLPEDTEFAYAATLGRLVAFLAGSIAVAMFPKVASKGVATARQKEIFRRSFGYTALLVAAAVVVCWVFAGLLAHILFGIEGASANLKLLIRMMVLVMALSSLLNVAVQYLLAQRKFAGGIPVVLCAGLYLISTLFLHDDAMQIVIIAGSANGIALIASLWAVLKQGPDRAVDSV